MKAWLEDRRYIKRGTLLFFVTLSLFGCASGSYEGSFSSL